MTIPIVSPADAADNIDASAESDVGELSVFGTGFKLAKDFDTTADKVNKLTKTVREDTPPDSINPWEMRLGGSRFFVPPLNINVSQTFRAGALSNGALRQQSSPKFHTGHSETVINLTLYFPNQETLWGFSGHRLEIDFDHEDDAVIDQFASSLRGLIAQFRYAPFLPVRNDYLNKTHNITAVAMHSMTVSTVEKFPFAVAVNLTMLKFNHKVYLPMIEHFDQAIHWGKFRSYLGRAAIRLNQASSRAFLEADLSKAEISTQPVVVNDPVHPSLQTADEILKGTIVPEDLSPLVTFNKQAEIDDGKNFEIFYPYHSPAKISLPNNTGDFRLTEPNNERRKSWWQQLLSMIGLNVDTDQLYDSQYEINRRRADDQGFIAEITNEDKVVRRYLDSVQVVVENMGLAELKKYSDKRIEDLGLTGTDEQTKEVVRSKASAAWFFVMYKFFLEDPTLAKVLAFQDLRNNSLFIQEWEVPMARLGLDPTKVFVQNVSVSMGNNIARMQVQMQDEPVHQHIGGQDTRCEISMIVMGESELVKLRTMFNTINGLARLEHNHGVLGFLGIKNILTALCGMRYVMPLSFEVNTVPNYPHVYQVALSFTDFDVFQQKREILSSEQQAELIKAFGKNNPFLRIKQLWGAFSGYPDFPLAVRDGDNKVVGYYDPDFYFKSFLGIDDDIVDDFAIKGHVATDPAGKEQRAAMGDNFIEQPGVHYCLGKVDNAKGEWISNTRYGVDIRTGSDLLLQDARFNEPHAGNMIGGSYVPGLTPPSQYIKPYHDGSADPTSQYARMMKDLQYRDKNGRMVRAFPTYMLWLIDEGGLFAGVKLFDNFYGLQAVLDFSLVQSEDIMADTLVLRVSNLYSRLSTKFKDLIDEDLSTKAKIINTATNRTIRLLSGLTDYLVKLDTIDLKPGVRVHLRSGYSSDPNNLDIIFNGMITDVQMGEVMTITCQSDAIELGEPVNSTDKEGHSGNLDGNLFGMYLSEPRDLMTRLLTMGSSVFKEVIAAATAGMIFSENKFGIKHFGAILYEPLTIEEAARHEARGARIRKYLDDFSENPKVGVGEIVSLTDSGTADILSMMWTNLSRKRDYEIFKRNIYPGNGTGVAQYMGGDLDVGGLALALATNTNPRPDGAQIIDPVTGSKIDYGGDPVKLINDAYGQYFKLSDVVGGMPRITSENEFLDNTDPGPQKVSPLHTLFSIMGMAPRDDDDISGADEVCFRAQTFMKSVWDLFQLCAALLPNYIVAIRPFEGRSTIFYGKPHWMYTSGVIPLTTGVDPSNEPALEKMDQEWQQVYNELASKLAGKPHLDEFYSRLSKTFTTPNPTDTIQGLPYTGGDPTALPDTNAEGARLVTKQGHVIMEMHLPTTPPEDHIKSDGLLPPQHQYPFYMDRSESGTSTTGNQGGIGGRDGSNTFDPHKNPSEQSVKIGDDPKWLGVQGYFNPLSAAAEEYYCCQWWSHEISGFNAEAYRDARILIYNPDNQKAVVCTPGDSGPSTHGSDGNFNTGVSPEAFYALGLPSGVCYFGFLPKSEALGPRSIGTGKVGGAVTGAQPTASRTGGQVEKNITGDITPEYAFDFGWKDSSVPVNYTDPTRNIYDEAGLKAESFYGERSQADGDEIWDEFRDHFSYDSSTRALFASRYPDLFQAISLKDDSPMRKTLQDFQTMVTSNFGNKQGPADIAGTVDTLQKFIDKNPILRQLAQYYPKGKVGFVKDALAGTLQVDKLFFAGNIRTEPNPQGDAGSIAGGAASSVFDVAKSAVQWEWDVNTYLPNAILDLGGNNDWLNKAFGLAPEQKTAVPISKEQLAQAAAIFMPPEQMPEVYWKVVEDFLKFMWQNPYNRGWLVRTQDRTTDLSKLILDDPTLGYVLKAPLKFGVGTAGLVSIPGVGDAFKGALDSAGNTLGDVPGVSHVVDLLGKGDANQPKWDFNMARQAFVIYITGGVAATESWMQSHEGLGKDETGLVARAAENFYTNYLSGGATAVQAIFGALGDTISGVLAFVRLALMQMSFGMSQASNMQRRTNMLNRILNDSIYYAAGAQGSLLRLADNPFTREFGEPVIEVRQPFQRIHQVNSFQHILNNGVTETLSDVATVISAVSNGSNAVTVHFDKSAPAELQKTKVVDTGLFWDHPTGWLGLEALWHPVSFIRMIVKDVKGNSDEVSSKRVALWHLKESLKDIYSGELLILGDPSIRPHDLVYLSDSYEHMYGLFEVEQVIHHFTPETGFITTITPNALVTINDPARWSLLSYVQNLMSRHRLRTYIRHALQVRSDDFATLPGQRSYSQEDLIDILSDQLEQSTQYSGGIAQITKDFASSLATGSLLGTLGPVALDVLTMGGDHPGAGLGLAIGGASLALTGLNPLAGIIGFGGGLVIGDAIWGMWKWVRDNLLDEHGCYIQYLSHNGTPMDAGLAQNQGVAVGHSHAVTLMLGSLNLGSLSVDGDVTGQERITSAELLTQLGYTKLDINDLGTSIDLWNNDTYKEVRKLSGRNTDGYPFVKNIVLLAKVKSVTDGDTITVTPIDDFGGYPTTVRLAQVNAPEDPFKFSHATGQPYEELAQLNPNHPGVRASNYTRSRLLGPAMQAYDYVVALRIVPVGAVDKFALEEGSSGGRLVAYIFHNGLEGQTKADRIAFLKAAAGGWPDVSWDSYTEEGLPYTYNWEIISVGNASVYVSDLLKSIPGEGVQRSGG